MKILGIMLVTAFLATGFTALAPTDLEAQTCTTKCGCISDGCGCSSSGGNGGGCSASGDGCFVKKCGTELAANTLVTPDGRFVALSDAAASGSASSSILTLVRHVPNARWNVAAEGHWVRRDCAGIVINQAFDKMTSDRLRREAAVMGI